MSKYTKEEKKIIKKHYRTIGAVGLHKLLPHRSASGLQKQAAKMRINFEGVEQDIPVQPDAGYLLRENEKLYRELSKEKHRTETLLNHITAILSKVKFKNPPPVKSRKNKHQLEVHVLHGDQQVGSEILSSRTQGLGKYNLDVFKKRMETMREKICMFAEQDKNILGNKLVLTFLGDTVEGDGSIYKKQPYNLEFSVVDQVMYAIPIERELIVALTQYLNDIEIFCIPGNHGASGFGGERDNWDYVFYKILQMSLKDVKGVKMYVSESHNMVVKHGDYNFMYSHSAGAKSWNSIPFYGLDRSAMKMNGLYDMIINFLVVGHFHDEARFHNVIVNGTMVGGSDLSINKMNISSVPSQKMFYFDKKWGINRESTLVLDRQPELKADNNGIFTAWS